MPTVATAKATVLGTARAWVAAGDVVLASPGPVHLPDVDDPNVTAWVTNHWCERQALLTTAQPGRIARPLDDAHSCQVVVSIDDPGMWALRLDDPAVWQPAADGGLRTTESADLEVHIYRKHAVIEQMCVPRAHFAPDGQSVTLTLVDVSWYLQQRRRGAVQPRNLADQAHWDGQHSTDGLFDAALAGWVAFGGATVEAVTSPRIDDDAPWTAKVTAPGTPTSTGMGLARVIPADQTVHGQPWRFIVRNYHPGSQPGFYFETGLRVVYMPPGITNPTDPSCVSADFDWSNADAPPERDTWNTWVCEIGVPVNTGGHLLLLMWCPESGYTYYGSRWKVIREDVLGTVDLVRLDLPAAVIERAVRDCALPGDTPYRNLRTNGTSPAGKRLRPRYPDIEAHEPFQIIQDSARDGGVNWRWDYTPTRRTLIAGNLWTYRWEWPITLDDPAGYVTDGVDADATEARNRIRFQGLQDDWSRDQMAAIAASRPGAVIDEVMTATRQLQPSELRDAALQRLTWRQHTPHRVTGTLPGDAIHQCRVGDFHPVQIDVGTMAFLGVLRSVSLDYDPAIDRCPVALAPWVPVEALNAG